MRLHWLVAATALAYGQDLPRGQVIPDVKCSADSSQSYALYIPSNYRADRAWSVIFAFDPGARGHIPVERLLAGAELYGYIVAGSNNSRNGPMSVSAAAAQAMWNDVFRRFSIDDRRVYEAGFSGGARVAMQIAMATGKIAGVLAASAGFPDATPRKSIPFAMFGTAGTGDFNNPEMREVDRHLSSPHRVAIFDGGHEWPPAGLASEAVEWLELQAMRSGLRPRDEALVDRIFEARKKNLAVAHDPLDEYHELHSLAADFEGWRDVSEFTSRAAQLQKTKKFQDAAKKERGEAQGEERTRRELDQLVAGLDGEPADRAASFGPLKAQLTRLAEQATASQDSAQRRLARRLLGGVIVGSREVEYPEYQKLLETLRPAMRP